MNQTQLSVINSRIRQLFQERYEFKVIQAQLSRHKVDLGGALILDAGCGAGFSSAIIVQTFRPRSLVAFDLLPDQVRLAQQNNGSGYLFAGDIAGLPLAGRRFDAIFTFGVFHHVPNWRTAIAESYRVLRPGGVLVGGELKREKELGFEWSSFAQDLAQAGFVLLESQDIYLGYFSSFLCAKPMASENP